MVLILHRRKEVCIIITRSIQIPDEMYAKLEEIAKEKGVSIAAIIKLACGEYIKQSGK
jgi:predicted DNA-binding protein